MKRILLTGAGGIVGQLIRPLLVEEFGPLVITDIAELEPPKPDQESFHRGDIADLAFVSELASQVEGIVHLAGVVGPDFTFEETLSPNITGTWNILEAARQAGGIPVVYASSHHAVGFYQRGESLDDTTPPRPDSPYGLSKAFGEAAASFFADKFGLNVLAIRIGYVGTTVPDERRLHTWISPRDLAQLIQIGLTTENLGYQAVYGVSEVPEPFFENANAERLGYCPQDRAVDHLEDPSLLAAKPDSSRPAGVYIGGHFAE